MKRIRRQHAFVLALCLLTVSLVACALWLRAQQREYALNRRLISAIVRGDDKRALALVEAGADPNTPKPTPMPPLIELLKQFFHLASPPVRHPYTAFSMVCGTANVEDEPHGATMMLHILDSGSDQPQLVQAMLTHGARVNTQDVHGWTPLIWAAACGHAKTVSLLLQHNARTEITAEQGQTALMWAAQRGNVDIMLDLLAHRANIDAQDEHGWTPGIYALNSNNNTSLMRLLLERGASINVRDKYGQTLLHHAVWDQADKATFQYLLHRGADPNVLSRNGGTPMMMAKRSKRPDIVMLLKRYGAVEGSHP